jgi:Putative metallopeptidase
MIAIFGNLHLLLAWVFITGTPAGMEADVAKAQPAIDRATSIMRYPGADRTSVQWATCFTPNAFYDAETDSVFLCYEIVPLLKDALEDDWVLGLQAIVAHEMGHSVVDHQGIPYTGSQEAAADEIAAITLGAAGLGEVNEAISKFWVHIWPREILSSLDGPLGEDHPNSNMRARFFACMAAGEAGTDPLCEVRYRKAWDNWSHLLWTWQDGKKVAPVARK